MVNPRVTLDYKNFSERFTKPCKKFTKQYCNIYVVRLTKLTPIIIQKAQKRWRNHPVVQLHELITKSSPRCIIIGTLFKDQKLKPSLLKLLSESTHFIQKQTHYTDNSDVLYVENNFERYELIGLVNGVFVTGTSCALLVSNLGKGKLQVHDYCFAGFPPQIEFPTLSQNAYLVFTSGFNLTKTQSDTHLQLLVKWLSGVLGPLHEIPVSEITALIIAGNNTRNEPQKPSETSSLISKTPLDENCVESVVKLDHILTHLSKHIDVHVLPSKYDPSDYTLPQKPMHKCMFENASRFQSLRLVSNPYDCQIGGLKILGTSGEPVTDILDYSVIETPLKALESCLKWRHLAPTAPDTLGCFPFESEDPFVLDECPHVLFAGNQKAFGADVVYGDDGQRVGLVCVPEFSDTHTVCVLNLRSLECFPIVFNV